MFRGEHTKGERERERDGPEMDRVRQTGEERKRKPHRHAMLKRN